MGRKKKRTDENLNDAAQAVQKHSHIVPTFRIAEVPAPHNSTHSESTPMASSLKLWVTTIRKVLVDVMVSKGL
jgi:hypothetical protein